MHQCFPHSFGFKLFFQRKTLNFNFHLMLQLSYWASRGKYSFDLIWNIPQRVVQGYSSYCWMHWGHLLAYIKTLCWSKRNINVLFIEIHCQHQIQNVQHSTCCKATVHYTYWMTDKEIFQVLYKLSSICSICFDYHKTILSYIFLFSLSLSLFKKKQKQDYGETFPNVQIEWGQFLRL